MNTKLKSKLVKRLRELADGARPAHSGSIVAYGLCTDAAWTFAVAGKSDMDCYNFIEASVEPFMGPDSDAFVFPSGDWGNDRRTLAGILASYIETEC